LEGLFVFPAGVRIMHRARGYNPRLGEVRFFLSLVTIMTMRSTVTWILLLGAVSSGGFVVASAQNRAAAPAGAARPANAPPLVPVRLNADGNFRIAPPYLADPAFTAKPDVPKGRVIRFMMNSAESKIFPTAPAGRAGGPGGGRGQSAPAAPAEPPQHQTFQRQIAVYVPAGYVASTPAPFIVVQDERSFIPEDAAPAADGKPRTDLPFIPVMLDNLIHEKRIPPIVAVLLSPGPGAQRSIEYDTVSDRYLNFVETEVLPRITRDYQVAFTTDPEGRATLGESSGAAAALTMAWLNPNLYRRVISYSGTFVALQRNATAPNGAWDFHQTFIPNSERKPLRIWLHVSENDIGATSPVEQMRNWVAANTRMAAVLKAKGYPYQFVFSEASGHVERSVEMQTMPEAFEWVWKGYKPSGR
jgi:enterochelin esterase-like enzyme